MLSGKIYLKLECRLCFQTALSVRVCGGEGQHKFILCRECDALYDYPNLEKVYQAIPFGVELTCPTCEANLDFGERHETSHWATEQEIIDAGWGEYIFYPDQST